MPASDHPTSGLYLRGLLAAGARPFAPRSGVYRLLGRPAPQGSAMRFPPPLPPVGFVYEHLAGFGGAGDALLPPLSPSVPPVPVSPVPIRSSEKIDEWETASSPPAPSGVSRAGASPGPSRPVDPPGGSGLLGEAPRVEAPRGDGQPAAGPPVEPLPVVEAAREPAARPDEKRVGLAIPGFTQRRSVFAALAGALPYSVGESPDPAPPNGRVPDVDTDDRAVAGGGDNDGLVSSLALQASRGGRLLPASTASSSPGEATAFRARTRSVEEVEHVRRAADQGLRVTPETVRAVAREVVQEATREGRSARRESPARRDAPASAPVVVVQRVEGAGRQVPRAFWSSSALRSPHLRMLR